MIAPIASGASGGWSLDDPPGTGDDVAMMLAVLSDATTAYNVERSRTYLWGFSAGGHVAHEVALNHGGLFAAYGVSAGVLRAVTCDSPSFPSAPACMSFLPGIARKMPVDVHIGTGDSLYPETQADRTRLTSAGWTLGDTLSYVPFNGGHTYTVAQLGEVWNHLCPFALGP